MENTPKIKKETLIHMGNLKTEGTNNLLRT